MSRRSVLKVRLPMPRSRFLSIRYSGCFKTGDCDVIVTGNTLTDRPNTIVWWFYVTPHPTANVFDFYFWFSKDGSTKVRHGLKFEFVFNYPDWTYCVYDYQSLGCVAKDSEQFFKGNWLH